MRHLVYKLFVEPWYDVAVWTINKATPKPIIGWQNWVLGGFLEGRTLVECIRTQYMTRVEIFNQGK